MTIDTMGWWEQIARLDLRSPSTELPRATDRFEEAKHFLGLVIGLVRQASQLHVANWYSGAHISAVISIRDGAETDCRCRSVAFENLPIAQEYFLTPDVRGAAKDPTGINRAYREFRNLRTHFGSDVVRLESRVLIQDIGPGKRAPARWFFAPLDGPELMELKRPQLTFEQRALFNEFAARKSFIEVASHHLYIVGRVLQTSAEAIAVPHVD